MRNPHPVQQAGELALLCVVLLGAIFDITLIGHHKPGIADANNVEKIYD